MTLSLVALAYAAICSAIGWGILYIVGDGIVPEQDKKRYLIAWFALLPILFLAPTGAAFLFAAFLFLLVLRAAGGDSLSLTLFLLAAVPPGALAIYGLPFGINYLLAFNFPMMLCIVFLLPKSFGGSRLPGGGVADALVWSFFLIVSVLSSRETSFTDGLRQMTTWFLLVLVPYLAFSRGVRTEAHLTRLLGSFLTCLVIAAVVGFAGSVVHWQIYDVPLRKLFGSLDYDYMIRNGLLRTGGTLGSAPIEFGLVMAVGALLCAGFAAEVQRKWHLRALVGVLLLGLLASVSRGPMVGAVVGMFAYQMCRPNPLAASVKTVLVGVLAIPVMLLSGFGRGLVAMIPFISASGTDDTVTYRQDLFSAGMEVFRRQPFLGSPNYLEEPEMQAMRNGEGIIDMVNIYLSYALRFGVLGLSIYIATIITVLLSSLFVIRRLDPDKQKHLRNMGAGLFAAYVVFAFTVATTSLTGILLPLGFMLLGLNVAHSRVAKAALASTGDPVVVQNAKNAASDTESRPAVPEKGPVDTPPPMPAQNASIGPRYPEGFVLEGFGNSRSHET